MKRIKFISLVVALLALSAGSAFAQITLTETETTKLYITLNTVGTAQALSQENVFGANGQPMGDLAPGFQNAYGDLGFIGKFGEDEEIEVVFDMYLSSRNHPSTTYGNEGYIILRGVPENLQGLKFLKPVLEKVDVKAGHMLINFGDGLQHRSNNAIVQANPLVGNFVVDPNIVSIGMEVSNKPGRINWLLGASNGTTTEDWNFGRGFSYHGKLAVYPIEPLRLSASYIAADHSDNPNKSVGGSQMQMFTGNRSGERYGGVLGGGQAPGGVFPQAGEKFSAAQFDLTWDSNLPIKLYGHYGITEDQDLNGSLPGAPEEKWAYYAGDLVYKFTPSIYAAARYSAAQADMLTGRASEAKVDRIQVGGGLWLTKNLLLKVEYVTQKYSGFAQGDMINNGVQAWRDPEFSGVLSEVSFSF
jgi:predicted porin